MWFVAPSAKILASSSTNDSILLRRLSKFKKYLESLFDHRTGIRTHSLPNARTELRRCESGKKWDSDFVAQLTDYLGLLTR
jgi:hypothetical protein